MDRFPRWNLSSQTRSSFNQLLDEAKSLGIDPDAVVAAGLTGLRALLALKHARDSSTHTNHDRYLSEMQDALRILQHRKHSNLVQQFQARLIAMQGRGNDAEIAHVARGEIVVPRQLQTPEVLEALRRAAAPYDVPIEMLEHRAFNRGRIQRL